VLAAVALAGEERPRSEAAAKRAIKRAVNEVSEALGNTPAVCRASYIDPRVLDRFRDGATIAPAPTNGRLSAKRRRQIEKEVIDLVS
jgi:DNA topoisomerase-1